MNSLWQRYREPARKIVFRAQEEAQIRDTEGIATEHFLLAAVYEPDPTAEKILTSCGLSIDEVREELARLLPIPEGGAERALTAGQMIPTPRMRRALDMAYEEAMCLGNKLIGPEHLILGLVRDDESLAGRLLGMWGMTLECARKAVLRLQDGE